MRLLVVAGPSEVPSGLPAHQRVPLQDLERSQPECDTALVLGDTARLARAIAALPAGTAIAFGGAIEVARLLAVDPSPKAAVDRLRAGHRYPDILGYTLAQVSAFLAAEARLEAERLAAQLAVTATAESSFFTTSSVRPPRRCQPSWPT